MGTFKCRLSSGTIECDGGNGWAMRGLGHARLIDDGFTVVPGIRDATAVGIGQTHVCALHATGTVSCWGSKMRGQMGYVMPKPPPGLAANDPSLLQMSPEPVPGIQSAQQLVVGDFHACTRDRDGVVSCWGWLDFKGRASDAVTRVPGIPAALQIFAGKYFACSLAADRQLYCWGSVTNSNGSIDVMLTPRPVFSVPANTSVVSGFNGLCAGSSCWGERPRKGQ